MKIERLINIYVSIRANTHSVEKFASAVLRHLVIICRQYAITPLCRSVAFARIKNDSKKPSSQWFSITAHTTLIKGESVIHINRRFAPCPADNGDPSCQLPTQFNCATRISQTTLHCQHQSWH